MIALLSLLAYLLYALWVGRRSLAVAGKRTSSVNDVIHYECMIDNLYRTLQVRKISGILFFRKSYNPSRKPIGVRLNARHDPLSCLTERNGSRYSYNCSKRHSAVLLKKIHVLCLLLDASLNISTSHFTSTPSAFEVTLQLTSYTNYLLTYLLTYFNILLQLSNWAIYSSACGLLVVFEILKYWI